MTRNMAWLEIYGDLETRHSNLLFLFGKIPMAPSPFVKELVRKYSPHLEHQRGFLVLRDYDQHRDDALEAVIGVDNLPDAIYDFVRHSGLVLDRWFLRGPDFTWNILLNYKNMTEDRFGADAVAFPRLREADAETQARVALFFGFGKDTINGTDIGDIFLAKPRIFKGSTSELFDADTITLFERMISDFGVEDGNIYLKQMKRSLGLAH